MKHLKETVSISRDLKLDDNSKENLRYSEESLKSVTHKFLKEPLTVESVDKKFRQMTESTRKDTDTSMKIKVKKNKKPERAIFYDIFIKPKENKIQEIIEKRKQKLLSQSVTIPTTKNKQYISNKITIEGKIVGMNTNINGPKVDTSSLSLIKENDELKKKQSNKLAISYKNNDSFKNSISLYFQNSLIEKENDISILNKYLHDKFILNKNSSNDSKKSYFNQLIQIRPPKGINSVSSNPFIENQGYAPSIPSLEIEDMNTNINELMTRAKGGIKNGDITKESHMSFYLAQMNEKEKKFWESLKFYQKFFLTAKLLDDIYGMELALNRIGIVYSDLFDFKQSKYYNEKHKEIATHNLNSFVCYYNCGLCNRILEDFDLAIKNFENALKLSEEENDLESYSLCLAQLAITKLFLGNINEFFNYSNEFFNKNKRLNHKDIELEMDLLNGFIYNFINNYDIAKDFYKKALNKAEECSNIEKVQLAIVNIGMIDAERNIDEYMNDVIEGKEINRDIEPEYIPPPDKYNKLNKSLGSDNSSGKLTTEANDSSGINYSKITETEVSYAEYRKNYSNRNIQNKKVKDKSTSKDKKKVKKQEITKKVTQIKKIDKIIEDENIEMIGGGEIIGEDIEEETLQMIGGGVMTTSDDEKENEMMIGGGEMISDENEKEEETEVIEMIGGGEIIEPSDEKDIMIGGGEIIEPSDEKDIMVGGGEIIEPSDEKDIMEGGGVMIDDDNEKNNNIDNDMMIGGGEMIDDDNEKNNNIDNDMMIGGGEMIDEEDDKGMMVGGGEMIDVDNDDEEMMVGGGEMIDEGNDEEVMVGGGEMIDEGNDEEMMIGGGEMIGDEDILGFNEPEEVQ